ncbi:MAG: Trp family transcriptional regulator [Candidatus Gracilibacteria bacterium]|jgi:TrpR family trp operon transcriptional repressor
MRQNHTALKNISKTFVLAESKKTMMKLLSDLLTPAEIHDIHERILIMQELYKGKPQREIAKKLGVSIAKVSRGSQVLQYGEGSFDPL